MPSNFITSCFKILLLLLVLSYVYSCSDTVTKQLPNKNYKMDLSITNSEFNIDALGMVVLPPNPKQNNYVIEFESDGRMDLFTFTTCSRSISVEDARKGLNRKKFLINYTPNEIESSRICPIEVWAYEEAGRHSRGYIEVEDKGSTLPFTNVCGDKTTLTRGVGVCQGKAGLVEKVKFAIEVIVIPDPNCDTVKSENGTDKGKEFTYTLCKGFTTQVFIETKGLSRLGRLSTYGYEEILIRR